MKTTDVTDSISRREFCAGAGAALMGMAAPAFLFGKSGRTGQAATLNVAKIDRARILRAAERYLNQSPVTIYLSIESSQHRRKARLLF